MKTAFALSLLLALPAFAEPARIENVSASRTGSGWTIGVTILHPDTGWEHYTDAWRVLDMAGNELGIRLLAHPHVDEQPFTRSLSGVKIPEGTTQIQIQSRDVADGWNAQTTVVPLP